MFRFAPQRLLLSVTTCLLASSFGSAEEKNEFLEEIRRREQVAAQAFEQEVKADLAEADRLKGEPGKAAEVLRKLREKVRNDTALSLSRRATLLSSVRDRLEEAERNAVAASQKSVGSPPTIVRRVERSRQQDDAIHSGVDSVRVLRQQGKVKEAQRTADDLARQFPDNTLIQQLRRNTAIAEQLHEAASVRNDKAARTGTVMRDIYRSATPTADDVVYPPDFAAKSAKRKAKYTAGLTQLTKREQEILRTLNEVIGTPLQLKDQTFDEVIKYLEQVLGQPLIVNKIAVSELKIESDVPINVALPKGITKRTVLRRVLGDLGLTYIVKNEMIEVTSVMRAQNELVVRYYQIDDLIGGGGMAGLGGLGGVPFGAGRVNPLDAANPLAFGGPQPGGLALPGPGGLSPQQALAEQLIEMIQGTVDPGSWQKNGGPGTITFFAPTRTLIIKNTAEVHNMLGGGTLR